MTGGLPLVDGILEKKSDRSPEELVDFIGAVYQQQNVTIHKKHIEIIVRQLMSKIEIIDAGDSRFLKGETVDKGDFLQVNRWISSKGGQPAVGKVLRLGISELSRQSGSFLSAASFSEPNQILAEAAVRCACDNLVGIKEHVMVGKLIPVGTGFKSAQQRAEAVSG